MSSASSTQPATQAPQDFASLLRSLSVPDGKPLATPAQDPLRPSTFAAPSSLLMPDKLPTYTESESTRGTKRKADLPATKPIPDPSNPFYDPRLDLKHAAGLIYKTLKAAHTSTDRWAETMIESHFLLLADKSKHQPDHALNRISKDITHIADLLRLGRKGWTLTDLPYNLFQDVEQLIPDIVIDLNKLSEYHGCGWLLQRAVLPTVEVEKRLRGIHKERQRIETEYKAKQAKFWNEDARKLIKKEDPTVAMERVFGFKSERNDDEERVGKGEGAKCG
ncbi:hypothetical protein DOTSEDRAFT_18965 [Dothistroma septosporum NZE10]|uniref:Uncharacterized protein n=1 Tax=Dothistroma septosporum (strain NZE10 / CBS 128990) TaxID=675120 RepID=N1PZJ5_DOTSN|nr:hypothetical protein DOTSEDRAFT_18965 [Dothistroma septosporum NZE10]